MVRPQTRYRLPLFPLPVVLLPGTALPLHIFEQRYRDLVAECLENERPFGMVYHDWDDQGPFLSEEGRVGCVAEIRDHRPLEDGRSLIVVDAKERFAIDDGVKSDSLYFEALVTPYDDRGGDGPALVEARAESIALFRAVVESLPDAPDALPDVSPEEEASFPLAGTIKVEPGWHQHLLELRDERTRLEILNRVFRGVLDQEG